MSAAVEACLRELVASGEAPGAQYARVERDGRVAEFAAGWAEVGSRRPMTLSTPMMAYSVSKLLTAEAVRRLAGEGLLQLDDAVSRYVPWQPYGGEVKIRHLLEHRAGIPNPLPLRWAHLAERHGKFDEGAALRAVLRRHPRLEFAPGTRERYSNIGYWLLGAVVEAVTGRRFAAYVEETILRPLGVEIGYTFPAGGGQAAGYVAKYSALWWARPFLTAREMAGGHEGRWLRMRDHYVDGPAFGGAIGTAGGFCRVVRGWAKVEKEGGGAGFRCLVRVGERTGVLMTNGAGVDVRRWMGRLEGY